MRWLFKMSSKLYWLPWMYSCVLLGTKSSAFMYVRMPVARSRYFPVTSKCQSTKIDEDLSADSNNRRSLLVSMITAATYSAALSPENADATTFEPALAQVESSSSMWDWSNVGEMMKPPSDDREYLAYRMPNGIRVVLCSDSTSNEAGAAMDVHVGACSDPRDIPGLAHFNEHMLFLGTKDFPAEDSFEEFLSSNGGSSNAYTASEDTVYYFTLQAEADEKLDEGLQRFGSFFTCPLFTKGATERELNAIESENVKNLQSDNFRLYQIQKSRQNSEHPHSKFFTGNRQTLLEGTRDKGLDLRGELIRFYESHYSSNQMTLAVVGPQTLDVLKQMVERAFNNIPNRNVPKPEYEWAGRIAPFNGQSVIPSFGHIVKLVPVQDLRQVTLTWPIVYKDEKERIDAMLTKQSNYVGHLVGHEGPCSLLSYLKRKGWANSLSASGESELSDFETFEVTIGLSRDGLAAINDVIATLFSYLQMLRDRPIPTYIYNEVLRLEELQWRYATKGGVGSYVQSLATSLQNYPPSLCVAGPRRLALARDANTLESSSDPRFAFSQNQLDFTRSLIGQFLENLTVKNSMVVVMSKSFQGTTDRKEKWYASDFLVEQIPEATIMKWRNPPAAKTFGLDYPRQNPFIPSEEGLEVKYPPIGNDKLRRRSFEDRIAPIPAPQIIRDDGPEGRWTVYYKADDRFGQPKAFVIFQLLTNEVSSSAKEAALANMYEFALTDKLTEYAYDAGLAGLTYDVRVLPRGVRLTFGGYNDKLQQFATYISKKAASDLKDVLPKDLAEFERYKDLLARSFAAFDFKQPYAHCTSYSQLVLNPRRFQYSNKALRDATNQITLEELQVYAKTLWSSGKGICLVQGNVNKKEAENLVATIDKTLAFKPISSDRLPEKLEPLPLPQILSKARPTKLIISEPNPDNRNSASYVLIQDLSEDPKDHVLLELISSIVAEPFYEDLRTRQQLGYIVSSGVRALGKSRYLGFIVQSSFATNEKLTNEITKFLDNVRAKLLEKLGRGDFAVYVKSLIDNKTEPDKQLATEVTRNWAEIGSGRLEFDRVEREVAAALSVTKEDMLEFWDRLYLRDGRRLLVTEVVPQLGDAAGTVPPKTSGYTLSGYQSQEGDGPILGIEDIEQFRSDLEKSVDGNA